MARPTTEATDPIVQKTSITSALLSLRAPDAHDPAREGVYLLLLDADAPLKVEHGEGERHDDQHEADESDGRHLPLLLLGGTRRRRKDEAPQAVELVCNLDERRSHQPVLAIAAAR